MLADRICHVVQSAFDGRRIFIFSDGATAADEAFFTEIRAICDGGGFGSIIGRNSFQRKKGDALKFLSTAMGIYEGLSSKRMAIAARAISRAEGLLGHAISVKIRRDVNAYHEANEGASSPSLKV